MKRAVLQFTAALLITAVAATSYAQQPERPATADPGASQEELPLGPAASPDGKPIQSPYGARGGWLLQTLAALAIVVALIFGTRWLIQRASSGKAEPGGVRLVELLARSPIGFKTHILFLRVNQRIVVASQTPQGMSTLTVLDSPADVAWVVEQAQSRRRGFGSALRRAEEERDAAQPHPGVQDLMTRLRSMKEEKGEDQ